MWFYSVPSFTMSLDCFWAPHISGLLSKCAMHTQNCVTYLVQILNNLGHPWFEEWHDMPSFMSPVCFEHLIWLGYFQNVHCIRKIMWHTLSNYRMRYWTIRPSLIGGMAWHALIHVTWVFWAPRMFGLLSKCALNTQNNVTQFEQLPDEILNN